ncbi:hypothetical protein PV10_08867 [Exophiala mesophila]|uniref:J domain-containing protein n=1 Tax=Exophiala mesophila TaxID=212818 RepID=A0A0D1Z5W9_EXOME|nr:uncharacterized protein PV10_08867 [Exophiala mesophila]KIV89289.1 hypothetical protein PV10_08867 [Exophiala mesophila]
MAPGRLAGGGREDTKQRREARTQAMFDDGDRLTMDQRKPVRASGAMKPTHHGQASRAAGDGDSQSLEDHVHQTRQDTQPGTGAGAKSGQQDPSRPPIGNERVQRGQSSRHFDEISLTIGEDNPGPARRGHSRASRASGAGAGEGAGGTPQQRPTAYYPRGVVPTPATQPKGLQPEPDLHSVSQQPSSWAKKSRPPTNTRVSPLHDPLNIKPTNLHFAQGSRPRSPSPTAKLPSKSRSISYTSPLELLSEESKRGSSKAAPLTEENLRSLLRSFDSPAVASPTVDKVTTSRDRERERDKERGKTQDQGREIHDSKPKPKHLYRPGISGRRAETVTGTGTGTTVGGSGTAGGPATAPNAATKGSTLGGQSAPLKATIHLHSGSSAAHLQPGSPYPAPPTATSATAFPTPTVIRTRPSTLPHPHGSGSSPSPSPSPSRSRKQWTNPTGPLPSPFMPKSKSPKKNDKARERDKKKPSKHDPDPDTHPLNLPPDQLHRLYTAHMAKEEANSRASMSVDRDMSAPENSDPQPANMNGEHSSPPATPSRDAPGAFPEQSSDDGTNGTANGSDDRSPTPPPHKAPPPPKVDPEACKAAGNKFFKAKDYERAIAEYTKAVEAEPSNPTYLSNRAAAYISANKYSLALGDSLQANRLDPDNHKILHRLARIYTSLGRPEAALDTYAKIPDASVTDTAAARKALSSIELAEKQINSEDGNGNMALWSIDQAKQTLGAGTPTPRSWQILRARANLKIGTVNALGEVQAIAQSLMRDNPMDAEAIAVAGRALYLKDDKPRQGKSDYERAEDHFRQALNLDPDNADARNCLRTMKKLDRARTAANDLFKRGKFSDAVTAYTEALTIDPSNKVTNAKLLGNRAMARIKIKEYDEARSDCDQALKLDPTYIKAKRTRAKVTGESGDWEQAVKDYKALTEEYPSDADLAKELRNAELELKKSKRKDWYKILGVDKDAGDKEIERAYKRKAALLHPDKTMGDKAKEEEFKDCLEAKETLLDPQKRHMFDTGADLMEPGMGGGGFPGGFGGGMGGMGGGVQIDPEMLFNMMNGMGGGGGHGGGGFPGGAGGFRFANGGGGRGGFSPFG